MTPSQIFEANRRKLNAKLELLSIQERFFEFLINADMREDKAANIAFDLDFQRVLISAEFSDEEKEIVREMQSQFIPLQQYQY